MLSYGLTTPQWAKAHLQNFTKNGFQYTKYDMNKANLRDLIAATG